MSVHPAPAIGDGATSLGDDLQFLAQLCTAGAFAPNSEEEALFRRAGSIVARLKTLLQERTVSCICDRGTDLSILSTCNLCNGTGEPVADALAMLKRQLDAAVLDRDRQARRAETAEASLDAAQQSLANDIRARGWVVAVHNDYRLAGVPHTFWLFTRGDRCVKGEGPTDAEALAQVRFVLRETSPVAVAPKAVDNGELEQCWCDGEFSAPHIYTCVEYGGNCPHDGPVRDIYATRESGEVLERQLLS